MRTETDVLRSLQRYMWKTFEDDRPLGLDGAPRPWEIRYEAVEGEFAFPFIRVSSVTPMSATGPAAWQEVVRTYVVHAYPVPQSDPESSVMEAARVEEQLYIAFKTGFAYSDPLGRPYGLAFAQAPVLGQLAASTYVYAVTAMSRDGGETVPSDPVSVTTVGSSSRVFLGWNEVQGATSYSVYRGPDASHLTLLASTADAFYVDDGSVAPGAQAPPSSSSGSVTVRSAPNRVPLYDFDGVPLDGAASMSSRRSTFDFMTVRSVTIDRLIDPEDDRYWLVIAQPQVAWRRMGRVPTGSQIVQDVRLRLSV